MAVDLTIGVAGSGGDGVILLGEVLAKASAHVGLHTTLTKSFGPQIRGGESSVRVRVAEHPLSGADHRLDGLLLFHYADMQPFRAELPLATDTQVFVDAGDDTPVELSQLPEYLHESIIRVPLEELAMSAARSKQAKNMVLAGVIVEHFGWAPENVIDYITRRFGRHGATVIANNLAAVEAGRAYVRGHVGVSPRAISFEPGTPLYFLSGNEAFSLGALSAGCRFMAGYPISPASEILEWMSRELPRFGGTCVQAEDEIAAVCMAIGASYGGVRALTATSGPGFSLKQEAIGLAHMAEIPLVVADVQRCGPSTGIPTRTEQGDLQLAIFGGHGDNPRVVLAATTVRDCYELAHVAFEIAERFQTPVIVLLDQLIAQSQQTVLNLPLRYRDPGAERQWLADNYATLGELQAGTNGHAAPEADGADVPAAEPATPQREYPDVEALADGLRRYAITPSGVSPMSIPGMRGGEYVAVGIEHNEESDPTSSQTMHQAQTAKRFRKLEAVPQRYPLLRSGGSDDPYLGIVTWGSCFGVCAEAARVLSSAGLPAAVLAPQLLHPLPVEAIQRWIDRAQHLLVVEVNYGAQFYRYLRGYVDLPRETQRLNRAGGSPISLTELLSYIQREIDLPADFNPQAVQSVLRGRQG
jgi:2-oxoglutarate/2-oxoacid ferredoxin oxidoreductase subunit alpha